jgi:hypothetical protein
LTYTANSSPDSELPWGVPRLIYEDGLVLKGMRIVIPIQERKTVLKNLHISHNKIQGTLQKARDCVYWPRMTEDIKQLIQKCEVCNKYSAKQPKEPLQPHKVPDRAWKTVGADLFELNSHNYIISVDYSNWLEYEAVSKITSEAVISSMKRIFSRLGIPEKMVTDNGRRFISREFLEFAKTYGMQHTTVSPKHLQANEKAEKAVGVCKTLIKKSIEGKTDFYLALLEWRNIPQAEIGLSPAQRLYGRRLGGVVPTISKQLEPELYPGVQEKMKMSKDKQKQCYDRGSRPLKDLAVGDTIQLKLPGCEQGTSDWKERYEILLCSSRW